MILDEAIERYTNNAEYERTHGNLQGYLDFRQLVEWLKELKRLKDQQPCGDCISRQAVNKLVDELARAISDEKCHIQRGRNYGRIMQDILELSSVEPERKPGKWHLLDECANEGWYCDKCHKKVFKADFSNTMRKYKFCPNCGEPMEVANDT